MLSRSSNAAASLSASIAAVRRTCMLPCASASSLLSRSLSHTARTANETTAAPAQSILEESGLAAPTPAAARPVTARVFANVTLRRQALRMTQPWYIGSAEFRKLKLGGFGKSVDTRLPAELRRHKPEFEMMRLRAAEVERLKKDPARTIQDFKAGDKIVVTKYLSLNDRTKFERIAGLCLARQGGTRLSASFLMRSHKLGEDYEMRFPLWSPFIAQIHRLEDGKQNFRQKMYYLREGPRSSWEAKIPALSKPSVVPMTADRLSKESEGKVQVLNYQPMKKQQRMKKAGGLGAELAAAGGGDKKGGKPAPAPKKK